MSDDRPLSEPSRLPQGPSLEVIQLSKSFAGARTTGARRRGVIEAVRSVTFRTVPGGTLGIVGETGSGKSTLVRCIAGLTKPSGGRVLWDAVELTSLSREGWRTARRQLQIVLQNPYSTLDPRMTVLEIVKEPLDNYKFSTGAQRVDAVREVLAKVGLGPDFLTRLPANLSGGQRQRVALARALVLSPALVILDEPVSALDVSIQAQVVNLLLRLQRDLRLSYIVILHDLAVARQLCDRILVMYAGRVVEEGETEAVLSTPGHPYTRALVAASPEIGKELTRTLQPQHVGASTNQTARGTIGCRYRIRCTLSQGAAACQSDDPALEVFAGTQNVACHLARDSDSDPSRPVSEQSRITPTDHT